MPRAKYKGVWMETIKTRVDANRVCDWCRCKSPVYHINIDLPLVSNRMGICEDCAFMVKLFVDKCTNLGTQGTRTGRARSDRPNQSNAPRPMPVEPKVDILMYGDTLVVSPLRSSDQFEEYDDGAAEADVIAEAIRRGHTTVISRFPLNVQVIRRP